LNPIDENSNNSLYSPNMPNTLSPEVVAKVAALARLTDNPTPEFLEKYGRELGAILEYVEELQKVDTKGISPLDGIRTIVIENLREDIPFVDEEIRTRILANFPKRKGDLLEVAGIFE
jgi:aspartyl/glutamyl-tRNA(Asn/Gln) amidotransferase C subunit